MTLRVALVGLGRIGQIHLEATRQAAGVEVVGVFDQDRARAEERAAAYPEARIFDGWEQLLRDDRVDCVGVLLPHELHEPLAIEALRAGKHVVCEKPLAPTVAACQRMLDAARGAGRRLLPVHNRVFTAPVEALAELVANHQLGQVVLAQTTGFEDQRAVPPWLARATSGVLVAQAVHPMYALRWLLGDVRRVSCLLGDRKRVDMVAEDSALVLLKFANGIAAEMTCTFGIAHGPYEHAITLHGSDGYATLSNNRLWAIAPRRFGDTELHEIAVAEPDHVAGFRRMWENYAAGLVNRQSTRQTGEDGLRAVEIVQAAYRSNRDGRTVDLPLDPAS
jgi:predicted dehydrogenase